MVLGRGCKEHLNKGWTRSPVHRWTLSWWTRRVRGPRPRALQDAVVMDMLRGLAGIPRPPQDAVVLDMLRGLAGNDGM